MIKSGALHGLFPDNASREAIPTDFAVTNYTDKYNTGYCSYCSFCLGLVKQYERALLRNKESVSSGGETT
jgi:hypothetical protein